MDKELTDDEQELYDTHIRCADLCRYIIDNMDLPQLSATAFLKYQLKLEQSKADQLEVKLGING